MTQSDFYGGGNVALGSRAGSQGLIELGERIRETRRKNHLSQEAFAELIGVSVNTVIRVEGGQTAMSIEIFAKMVKILGVDADELLGEQLLGKDGEKEIDTMFFRIQHLNRSDQEIVCQTVDALIDGLHRHR